MLPKHEDPVLITSHVQTLRDLGTVIVDTVEEVQAIRHALVGEPIEPFVYTEAGFQMDQPAYALRVRMSVSDAATLRGINRFDTALQQDWVDMVRRDFGENVVGHFVWSYDVVGIFGYPAPITAEGDRIDERLASALPFHTRYADLPKKGR